MLKSKIIRVLNGERLDPPPIWMMRQAGRYLPEYLRTRKQAGSFLDLCYNSDLAVEVSQQPIRRFGFDAAILFSDILVVPHALGRKLEFVEGRGPVLDPIDVRGVLSLDNQSFHSNLSPVYETVQRLRCELSDTVALLGFCGAPWTVATYMIAGHGTPDQAPARLYAYQKPDSFKNLLAILADNSADYLIRQVQAGADAVQIFDSWSGVLDEQSFRLFCIEPTARMVQKVRAACGTVPIIGFPKGAGVFYEDYRKLTGVDAVGLDWTVPMNMAKRMQIDGAVQGNLDPMRLVAGGSALENGVKHILDALVEGPFIFNLGHGITPHTPLDHVQEMVDLVRGTTSR